MRRVYKRSFDWDEAKRLHEDEGMTYPQLAERFGVSTGAIGFACNPRSYELAKRRAANWTRENARALCLGGCGRLVWLNQPGRSGYCRRCYGREVQSLDSVRPDALLCHRCEQWLPDTDFPFRRSNIARRERSHYCRACETAARQDYRERNKIPCNNCGRPRLPRGEKGNHTDSGLCRDCYEGLAA